MWFTYILFGWSVLSSIICLMEINNPKANSTSPLVCAIGAIIHALFAVGIWVLLI